MRRPLSFAMACLFGCADYQKPATFPREAAGAAVINEQAILGLDASGDALVASLIDADAQPAELRLFVFDAHGAPSIDVLDSRPETARAVSRRLVERGHERTPQLEIALRAEWPEAFAKMLELGFKGPKALVPEPASRKFAVAGVAGNGSLPLVLRLTEMEGSPRALAMMLGDEPGGPETELSRMPLAGEAMESELFVQNGVAWLLAGSTRAGEPVHRQIGTRRGSIQRGEAELHNAHGLSDYAAGDIDAARKEFARAIAADDTFVDSLYNAAATAALSDDDANALRFLKLASRLDPARVQVLGRDDEDLKQLRRRKDVRALLGLQRPPPENVPPP
jgi:hypothetical protein